MSHSHGTIDIHRIPILSTNCCDIVFINSNRGFQIARQIAGNNIHCGIFHIGCINERNHAHNFISWKITTAQCHSGTLLCTHTEKHIGGIVAGDQVGSRARFKCGVAIDGRNIRHIGQRICMNRNALFRNQILAQILRENHARFEFYNIGDINCEIASLFINQTPIEILCSQIHRIIHVEINICSCRLYIHSYTLVCNIPGDHILIGCSRGMDINGADQVARNIHGCLGGKSAESEPAIFAVQDGLAREIHVYVLSYKCILCDKYVANNVGIENVHCTINGYVAVAINITLNRQIFAKNSIILYTKTTANIPITDVEIF